MEKVNHALKARMYIGGLKSLFGDMHDMIADIEKTGRVPADLIQSFIDVKEAIDLTVFQLKKASVRCCDHADHPHAECDEECLDGSDDDEEEGLYCEGCDERCEDCECDTDEDDVEEEEPPPPPKKSSAKKPSAKNVDNKVVIPAKKKGK